MPATYMIVKIPSEILAEAVAANKAGQSYTIHIEGVIGNPDDFEDSGDVIPRKPVNEKLFEIPVKEIERMTQPSVIRPSDLQGKK